MNSLQDLNDGFDTIEFTDPRTAAVTFSTSQGNGTQNVLEGQSYSLYVAREITDIINYQDCAVTYRVNVSAIAGATVEWPSLPGYMSIANSTPGVYVVSGFRTASDWTVARQPTVNLPDVVNGTYTVTATINYLNTSTGWSITTNIQNVAEWTAPTTFWFSTGSNVITGQPNLSAGNTSLWTVTVTPSVGSYVTTLSTNGSGGVSSWNNTTKVLTILGTNTQINSHLNSITMVTNGEINAHMTFAYLATANSDGSTDLVTQNVRSSVIRYLGVVSSFTYNEDTPVLITGAPQVTDIETTSGGYFVQVVPNVAVYVSGLTSTSTLGGTSTFNNSTKRLTIVGTKAQVNDHLTKITMTPGPDVVIGFTLSYTVTNPFGATQTKTQTVNFGTQHDEIVNITATRTFINGQANSIFASDTPQITDLDTTNPQYTISMSVPTGVGTFSAPGTTTSRTWTYTGTRTQVNNLFSQIVFTPATGVFANTVITYSQIKTMAGGSTVQQLVNYSITLNGPRVAFDTQTPQNQFVTTTEGATHSVPVGANVVGVNDFTVTTPIYTIDLTAVPGSTVTWPVIPSGCSVTIPSADIYRINGITNATVWNQVRSPTVTLNNYSNGTLNYTATVSWSGPLAGSRNWNVAMTISDVSPFTSASSFVYSSGTTNLITGNPTIVDPGAQTPTWTVVVTPSRIEAITSLTSTGSGGTSTANSTTKVLTITGTTAQVNSHLNNMTLTVPTGKEITYTLGYVATSSVGSETASIFQSLSSNTNSVLSLVRNDEFYSMNATADIINGPLIADNSGQIYNNYTMTIKPTDAAAVGSLSTVQNVEYSVEANNKFVTTAGTYINEYFDLEISDNGNTMIWVETNQSRCEVYTKTGNTWTKLQSLGTLISGGVVGSASISGDASYIAVGDYFNQLVDIYVKSGSTYSYQTTIYGDVLPPPYDVKAFANSIHLNSNGSTLAVLDPLGGDLYVFARSGTTWTKQTKIAVGVDSNWIFAQLKISNDGNTMATTSPTGVKIYTRSGSTWTIQHTFGGNNFSDLSSSGNRIIVGSTVYARSGTTWSSLTNLPANINYTSNNLVFANDGDTLLGLESFYVGQPSNSYYRSVIYRYNGSNYAKTSIIGYPPNAPPGGIGGQYWGEVDNTVYWGAISEDQTSVAMKYYDTVGQPDLGYSIFGFNQVQTTYDSGTRTLTLVGSKAFVNAFIDYIRYTPAFGYTANFELDYSVTTPTGGLGLRNQRVIRI